MTDMNKLEKLSQAVDEKPNSSTINMIADDGDLCSKWERYHIIGESLRNNPPECLANFHDKLAAKLEDEPLLYVPQKRFNNEKLRMSLAAGIAAIAVTGVGSYMFANQPDVSLVAQNQPTPRVQTLASQLPDDNIASDTHTVVENGYKIERLNKEQLKSYLARHGALGLKPLGNINTQTEAQVVNYPE
jgi:negative regulator of sigma E activity